MIYCECYHISKSYNFKTKLNYIFNNMEHQALVTFVVVHAIVTTLTKVCVINGKDTDDHKLQYFPNSLRGRATN
jgi:hypothetical protein